jgi:integrase
VAVLADRITANPEQCGGSTGSTLPPASGVGLSSSSEQIGFDPHCRDERRDAGTIVPFVFHRNGKRIKNVRGAWACKAAGHPGRPIHDMRRSAVRNLERDGVPRSAAMAMVGHKTESIYRRYAIVDSGALKEARIDRAAEAAQGQRQGQ